MLQDPSAPNFVSEVVTLFCHDGERIIGELAKLLYVWFLTRCSVFCDRIVALWGGWIESDSCNFLFLCLCRDKPTVDFDRVDAFVHQLKGSSAR